MYPYFNVLSFDYIKQIEPEDKLHSKKSKEKDIEDDVPSLTSGSTRKTATSSSPTSCNYDCNNVSCAFVRLILFTNS